MFETFGEYAFHLLTTPLRKVKQSANQLYIFVKVTGRLFDACKQDIFRVREQSMIATASDMMLDIHGQDRDMVRLKGETVEGYRARLMMKAVIAEKAGSKEGILLALASMGYELSQIEPFYQQDPERWAEFIIFLRSRNPGSVNDIRVIDSEIMRVKQVSSKPAYGSESVNGIAIYSANPVRDVYLPICGLHYCGTYPVSASEGSQLVSSMNFMGTAADRDLAYPKAGQIYASEENYTYVEGAVT